MLVQRWWRRQTRATGLSRPQRGPSSRPFNLARAIDRIAIETLRIVPGWLGVSINGETAAKAEQRQGSAPAYRAASFLLRSERPGRRRGKT